MSILVLDFETYWDSEFSLSKMPTDSYVLDERFKVHGCGVIYFPLYKDYLPRWLEPDDIVPFLDLVQWDRTYVLAHNTAFDGFILRHRYGRQPKGWLDTLSMARALIGVNVGGSLSKVALHYGIGAKGNELVNTKGVRDLTPDQSRVLGEYCKNDTALCLAAFEKMRPDFPASEMKLIDLTLRMFIEPVVKFNRTLLAKFAEDEAARKQALLDRISGTPEALRSNAKFAELLWIFGVDPPKKISPTTEKETWAFAKTDEAFINLLTHEEEAVRWLAEARLAVTSNIMQTRTQRFLDVGDRPWSVLLNYYGAYTTGRWSGGNKQNAQNMVRGSVLRAAVEPPPGHKVVVCDSSQIEARMLAFVAGQDDLLHLFREGGDPYCRQASALYGREVTKADKVERQVGKVLTLACGYTMGAEKFRRTLQLQTGMKMTAMQAQQAVASYRQLNSNIVQFWYLMDRMLTRALKGENTVHDVFVMTPDGIKLPNGMYIKYPGLRNTTDGLRYLTVKGPVKLYAGKAVENLVQALARIVVAEQMLVIDKTMKALNGRIWLMAHDEVCAVVPEENAERAAQWMLEIMKTPPDWAPSLPVSAEVGIGDNYGSAK